MLSGGTTALAMRGARLAYAGALLFDGLDIELPAGCWTCLLGPSGVGKSSLLRLLAGLEDGGSSRRDRARRDIAYMAQQDLLLPWLDVLGNATLGARLRGEDRGKARERAVALLREVGLGDRLHDLPAALSGGMRQRVALVRTLMEDRPIVLMDEPFSQLDAITRLELQDLAARLLSGRTVLLVTHDPLEALRLGHRIQVMAGRPASLGEPLLPPGSPVRDPADPDLLARHGELIRRLRLAREAA